VIAVRLHLEDVLAATLNGRQPPLCSDGGSETRKGCIKHAVVDFEELGAGVSDVSPENRPG
jgi:hypothetical protein